MKERASPLPTSVPMVSVVIPTHRRPAFLAAAIGSVGEAQLAAGLGASAVEIVVVDDGHDDATRQLCAAPRGEFLPAIQYLPSAAGPGAGPSHCRNQGVRYARGEYIYLLDDDDAFLPNRFCRSLWLLRDGGVDGVLERTRFVGRDVGSKGEEGPAVRVGPNEHLHDAFALVMAAGPREQHVATGATSFRKTAFEAAGGYDETLRYGEDSEFLLRLCLVSRVVVDAGDPVLRCRVHDNSATHLDRLQVWHNVRWLSRLSLKVRGGNRRTEAAAIHAAASAKLDYALYYYHRHSSSYLDRLQGGALTLRYFDWRSLSPRNLKSIVVWLMWPPAAS